MNKWLIALIATVVSLFMAELGATCYLYKIADRDAFTRFASLRQLQSHAGDEEEAGALYTPHNYLGYIPTPNYRRGKNRHNALGYRGDDFPIKKPEGEYRIVCLGGSTTYTTRIDDYHFSYPAQLEAQLRKRGFPKVRVINAGAGGYASFETLANFNFRILDLEPDMLVVYHAINDVHTRLVWPSEHYRGDNSGRRGPLVSGFSMPPIWEYSDLVRMLLIQTGTILPHSAIERNLAPSQEWYKGNLFHIQTRQGGYPEGVFKETTALRMLETNPPVYFKRNLENLIAVAERRNIDVVLATFAFSPQFTTRPRVSSKEYVMALNQMNDLIRNLADSSKAQLFDFSKIFPLDQEYFTDGRHVTRKGAILKGELFANYLIENSLGKH